MSQLTQKLPHAARILFGLTFTVFGLNGFLHFLPQPSVPEAALGFVTALAKSGYFFPLLKGTEVAAGLLLLVGRYVPLALAVLAPIIVNIAAFHLALEPNPIMVALLVGIEAYLAWSYRDAFAPMLKAHVEPKHAPSPEPNALRASAERA
jgi:uncharacterized membrane protein YphA (DoxX/SURF4 family)